MTMSISGLAITWRASDTTCTESPTAALARAVSRSATMVIWMPRPARRRISSWLRCRTLNVPLPTVPMPSRPTWIAFILRGSVRISFGVVMEEACDAPDRIGEVVGVGQEDHAEVVRRNPVEARALHDQHL